MGRKGHLVLTRPVLVHPPLPMGQDLFSQFLASIDFRRLPRVLDLGEPAGVFHKLVSLLARTKGELKPRAAPCSFQMQISFYTGVVVWNDQGPRDGNIAQLEARDVPAVAVGRRMLTKSLDDGAHHAGRGEDDVAVYLVVLEPGHLGQA